MPITEIQHPELWWDLNFEKGNPYKTNLCLASGIGDGSGGMGGGGVGVGMGFITMLQSSRPSCPLDDLIGQGTVVGLLVFWAQSTTKDYIRAKNNIQSVSHLLRTQVSNHNYPKTKKSVLTQT